MVSYPNPRLIELRARLALMTFASCSNPKSFKACSPFWKERSKSWRVFIEERGLHKFTNSFVSHLFLPFLLTPSLTNSLIHSKDQLTHPFKRPRHSSIHQAPCSLAHQIEVFNEFRSRKRVYPNPKVSFSRPLRLCKASFRVSKELSPILWLEFQRFISSFFIPKQFLSSFKTSLSPSSLISFFPSLSLISTISENLLSWGDSFNALPNVDFQSLESFVFPQNVLQLRQPNVFYLRKSAIPFRKKPKESWRAQVLKKKPTRNQNRVPQASQHVKEIC